MKSPSDSSISQPEEPTDVQSAIPKSATGLLSPLNLTSHPREASQNEIATLLRNADSLVPDAAGRGSSQHSIESTESTAGRNGSLYLQKCPQANLWISPACFAWCLRQT